MILNDPNAVKIEYNIDKNHLDTEQVKGLDGNMHELGEFRKVFSTYFVENKKGMLLFYDDIFQYTSLGLLDMLFELHHIDFKLPVEQFLTRGVRSEDFVKSICSLYDIDYREAQYIERKYYAEVLRRSPFSKNAMAFLKLRKSLRLQRFVYKWPCEGITDVLKGYQKQYSKGQDDYASLEADYLMGRTEKEYLHYMVKQKALSYLDLIVIKDAGGFMDFVEETHIDTEIGMNVYTTEFHNGLSPEQIASIYIGKGYGNGDYTISLMKEGKSL